MTRILPWFLCFATLVLHAAAEPDATPFPSPPSIKGLQVQMIDDALKLGIHHAGVNVSLASLMKPDLSINEAYARSLDAQIQPLADKGVIVYAIILAYPTKDVKRDAVLLHPGHRPDYKFSVGAFNTATPEGREWFSRAMGYLAQRWSKSVWGWIIGNEVNSHWLWYNLGLASMDSVAKEVAVAMRLAHTEVSKVRANARVYLSLDHHWKASMNGISAQEATPGRDFIDSFAKAVRDGEGGDFAWHIAHHPYPEDLGNPRAWADKHIDFTDDTIKVTFKNLEVLTRHLERPELLWQGKPRRVILSEQGFHTLLTPEGEKLQAAAFAYAWEKCQRLPTVDAFIYHRHVDHAKEGGLRLGLWRNAPHSIADPHSKKQLYDLFVKAGTPAWKDAAQALLPVTGLKSWDELAPK